MVGRPGSQESIELSGAENSQVIIAELAISTTYSIEVAAINSAGVGPYSNPITAKTNGIIHLIILCPILLSIFADALSVFVNFVSTTSLTISWLPADGVIATSYSISYTNTNCTSDIYNDIIGISPNETVYTLTGLQEGSHYSITVTVTLSDGQGGENSVLMSTNSTG